MSTFRSDLLKDKTAFISGASSGINLQIATRFALAGARVAIMSRSPKKIEAAAAGIRAVGGEAMGLAQDVRDHEGVGSAMQTAADAFGEFDILVSGAAGNFVAPFNSISYNGFRAVVDIDVIGTYNVLRKGFPHLRRPGASVINISAPQSFTAYPYQAHVNAAKAGVDMLTRTLAVEWGGLGVRVNSIVPGPIADTEGMARLAPDPESEAKATQRIPVGRFGTKDDIADLALFLSSPAASYITGTLAVCDGGQTLVGSGGMASTFGYEDGRPTAERGNA